MNNSNTMTALACALQDLRHSRLAQLRSLISARELDAAVIYAQGGLLGASTRTSPYLRMFVDWDGLEDISILVVTQTAVSLILLNPFQVPAAQTLLGVDQVLLVRASTIGNVLGDILGKGSRPRTVGVCGQAEMPAHIWGSVQQVMPQLRVTDLSEPLNAMRLDFDPAEVQAMRESAAKCDLLFKAFPGFLAPQKPAWQTQRQLECHGLLNGAEYCKTWLTISPAADRPRYLPRECHGIPASGDQVLLGVMLRSNGYWGHAIRMGSYREVKSEHQELHGLVRQMFNSALPFFQSGGNLQPAEDTMNACIAASSIAAALPVPSKSRFRSGHGLGLGYEEPQSVQAFPQYADPLDEGISKSQSAAQRAVFELHPNVFVPGVGGAALGDMVLVGDGGGTPLLSTPLDLAVWG